MGFAICHGACANCGRIFSFNPVKVPSIRINGSREPVCRDCIEQANPLRVAKGMAPLTYAEDAYEACAEEDLIFGDD